MQMIITKYIPERDVAPAVVPAVGGGEVVPAVVPVVPVVPVVGGGGVASERRNTIITTMIIPYFLEEATL